MRYVLTIYADESRWIDATPEEGAAVMAAYEAFGREAAEVIRGGEGLEPTSAATTVRVRDGEPLLTDGPFAETREQLGGYYVIEAESLDEALRHAANVPSARFGSIEVRPVVQMPARA
jgi:hypothetical protein